jgi:hypothetical protein
MLQNCAILNVNKMPLVIGKRRRRLGHWGATETQMQILLHAREMHKRFGDGDYRHSDSDASKLADAMNLIIRWHAENHFTEPKKVFAWSEPPISKTLLPQGSYRKAIENIPAVLDAVAQSIQ